MATTPPRPPLDVCRLDDRLTPAGTITGTVFFDYNANGRFDAAPPPLANAGRGPVAVGIDAGGAGPRGTAGALDAAGPPSGTAATGPDGRYTLTVSGTGPYRLEFDGLPAGGVFYGPT